MISNSAARVRSGSRDTAGGIRPPFLWLQPSNECSPNEHRDPDSHVVGRSGQVLTHTVMTRLQECSTNVMYITFNGDGFLALRLGDPLQKPHGITKSE